MQLHGISLKKRICSSSGWAFFTMLAWETVESLLEYAIAYLISSAITMLVIKFITTFLIVTAAQTITKPTQRFILTFVRKLTYKKGEDKVNILKKIWELLKSNKCSIVVILTSALMAVSGTSIINVEDLPAIKLGKDTVVTEIVYEVEPVYATEIVYEVEPVIAETLTFVANDVIYEADNITIKYNVGDIVANNDITNYINQVDVYQIGDVIEEGVVKYNIGDVIEEGIMKEETTTIPATNITPFLYYVLLAIITIATGVFFEKPEDYTARKESDNLLKAAKKELKEEAKEAEKAKASSIVAQEQKVAEAEKQKIDAEWRAKLDAIKEKLKNNN